MLEITKITSFQEFGTIIGSLTTIIGGIIAIKKWIIPLYYSLKRTKEKISKLLNINDIVENINKQLNPNGGSSIFDKLNRIELRQIKSETRHKTIVSIMNVGYIESDSKGQCLWVSPYWIELTGLSNPDYLGNGWLSTIHEDDRDMVTNEWFDSVNQKRQFRMKFKIKNVITDKVYPVNCIGYMMSTENDNNTIGYLCIMKIL